MDVGVSIGVSIGVGVGTGVDGGRGVLVAVASWTLMGVRVAVGWGVAVGGGTVGVAVGGVVGMGVGVSVTGGLGVLVGVGVRGGEGLQLPRRGSRNSPPMMQRQRKALVLETALVPIMIVLTSGE